MSNNSENKKVIAESEIGNDGVGHSKMLGESGAGVNNLSPDELKLALAISENQKAQMQAELDELKKSKASNSDSDAIHQLAELLSNAIIQKPVGPTEEDNINRTSGFKERVHIDGASLMEAQSTMLAYRGEVKIPVSVPKTFQSQFGPSLDITVNGVRVSIPCDGKTYFINETHAIHAKERIAKVDRLLSDNEPKITEIDA